MENEIDVSFVMTVYNKEYYLPSVIRALLNQTGLKNPEYIFVDDVSTDKSVEIIREMTKGIKNVKIFANTENRGISVRINQGIAAAEGKYTRLIPTIFFRSIQHKKWFSWPKNCLRIWFTALLPKPARSRQSLNMSL